eukprot:TRINITY_DN4671_c0_g2_i3.p1 TRINITY_DN4671_c0_g2~~TRINITY_DN4671_c0_g2_i3.p1  ORF type:complete len:936 (+),score=227.18 TRINITY_DN4671_c0_g2_i3:178-2808(+)
MDEAKKNKKGIWSTDTRQAVRKITYHEYNRGDASADVLFSFFEKHKGKTLSGVVEQVRTGSSLRIYLPSSQEEITVNLSGVHSPVIRYNDEIASEPFSREAKFFTEHCLLHRDVNVVLECMDKMNNFYGTVTHQQHNVSPVLLKMGLASLVEWHAPSKELDSWKELEKSAKDLQLRIWSDDHSEISTATFTEGNADNLPKEFNGTVVEIPNASTLIVRVTKGGEFTDIPVSMSSIKLPRAFLRRNDVVRTELQSVDVNTLNEKERKAYEAKRKIAEEEQVQDAYAQVAREYLRKSLIGKKVRASFDYIPASFTPPGSDRPLVARLQYSVFLGKQNIALDLVRKGYAEVLNHRPDEPRSPEYPALLLAEKSARQEGVGLHAPKSRAPIVRINDVSSEQPAKLKLYLSALQRAGSLPGVVEFPFSGSRFKVHLPTQGLSIVFGLEGCSTGTTKKLQIPEGQTVNFRKAYPVVDPETGDPIPGNAALLYARDTLLQRDVEVTINELDKNGAFMGQITVGKSNFMLNLVKAGLGRLFAYYSNDNSGAYKELVDAQNAAKAAKKGLWWDYDEEAEKEKEREAKARRDEEREERISRPKAISVSVTEVCTGSIFFYQNAEEERRGLVEDMMTDFASRDWQSHLPYSPKIQEWVAAKFSVDGSWYRAEVLHVINPKAVTTQVPKAKGTATKDGGAIEPSPSELLYELRFVDYGNCEITDYRNIRQLDPDFSKVKFEAFAKKAKLAYIKTPQLHEEFGEDSAALLKELVWGKIVLLSEQYKDSRNNLRNDRSKNEKEDRELYDRVMLGVHDNDEPGGNNINGLLVMRGLAQVERRRYPPPGTAGEIYTLLVRQEENAKAKRLCIWQYGTVPDSDEERQWANQLR